MRSSAKIFNKIWKFLKSLADFLSALAFLCCHYIFNSYVTCLILSFSILYVYFHSHKFFVHLQSPRVFVLATFKSILSQSRCSLEPKNVAPPDPQGSIDAHYACFSTDYVYSRDHAYLLSNLVPIWFFWYTSWT